MEQLVILVDIYNTIQIGEQIWMAENLRVTKYPNGISIPYIASSSEWGNLEDNNVDDAYSFNGTNSSSNRGALYTWAAAMGDNAISSNSNPSDVQGVCPDSWHLPSNFEWEELINYFGGSDIAGGKMKEIGTSHWCTPNTGATNESEFTAVPEGALSNTGGTIWWDVSVFMWSSTESGGDVTNAYFHDLHYDDDNVGNVNPCKKSWGYSVRCVKD